MTYNWQYQDWPNFKYDLEVLLLIVYPQKWRKCLKQDLRASKVD